MAMENPDNEYFLTKLGLFDSDNRRLELGKIIDILIMNYIDNDFKSLKYTLSYMKENEFYQMKKGLCDPNFSNEFIECYVLLSDYNIKLLEKNSEPDYHFYGLNLVHSLYEKFVFDFGYLGHAGEVKLYPEDPSPYGLYFKSEIVSRNDNDFYFQIISTLVVSDMTHLSYQNRSQDLNDISRGHIPIIACFPNKSTMKGIIKTQFESSSTATINELFKDDVYQDKDFKNFFMKPSYQNNKHLKEKAPLTFNKLVNYQGSGFKDDNNKAIMIAKLLRDQK